MSNRMLEKCHVQGGASQSGDCRFGFIVNEHTGEERHDDSMDLVEEGI